MVKLTPKQIETCRNLESGKRTPITTLQKRFVRVCRGEVPAITPYEKAYQKLRAKERRQMVATRETELKKESADKRTGNRNSIPTNKNASNELSKRDLEIKKKFLPKLTRVAEEKGGGTREDWKRDRGSWRR